MVIGQSEGKMIVSPFHVLIGVGAGLGTVFFLHNLSLALQVALTLGRMVAVALCVLLIGSAFGLWPLPRAFVGLFFWARRLWQPLLNFILAPFRLLLL